MGNFRQSVILGGILPLADLRFHTRMPFWYRRLDDMFSWSGEDIRRWQEERLQGLVSTAYAHSRYYRELFDRIGLKPGDIRTAKDLERIPPLTKDILRERYADILLDNAAGYPSKCGSTGGSTGDPVRYVKDNESWGFGNAFNLRMWQQTGYRYGDAFLALGSASLFPEQRRSLLHALYYRLKNKIAFNAMNLSPERLDACVALIRRRRIHFIYGYASAIFLLARHVIENGLQGAVDVKACFCTSEVLTATYREAIKEAFGCQVMDAYGAEDGGVMAHRLDGQPHYRVGYNCLIQTDGTQPFAPALLTDLLNPVFPFIRYEIGDVLALDGGYDGRYNGQLLKAVHGRTSDILTLGNGRVLTGPGFTVLFKDLPVKAYRITRTAPLEICVTIVPAAGYDAQTEDLIVSVMHRHAGEDCRIVVRRAEQMENRSNGKNLYFATGK